MKKKLVVLFVFLVALSFCCFHATASGERLIVSNNENEKISLSIDDWNLRIHDLPDNPAFEYMTAVFYKGSGYKSQVDERASSTSDIVFEIPYYSDGTYEVAIFTGNTVLTPFLPYTIELLIEDGVVSFLDSPTLKANKEKFDSSPSGKTAMDYYSFYYLSADEGDEQLRNVAKSLIKDLETDYEKAFAVYDWLTENFYYDGSPSSESDFSDETIKTLIVDKICDSKGFSRVFNSFMRIVGIPSRSVNGIGLVNNRDSVDRPTVPHYWNEIYIDGRWIIVDVSMGCPNVYLDGIKNRFPKSSNIYFDPTVEFFSYSHSTVSYEKPAYYEGYNKMELDGLMNGSKKTVEGLGLPLKATINTSIGDYVLDVEWDLKNCDYDPKNKDSQTFEIIGNVRLPSIFAACNSLNQKVKITVTVNERVPVKAEIKNLPNNLAFFVGGKLDTAGLELKVTFDNGDIESVKRTYKLEYDSSKIGEIVVEAKYKTVSTSFVAYVVSKEPLELKVSKKPNKIAYLVNSEFNPEGLELIAVCDRGLSFVVEDYEIEYDFGSSGEQEVVFTFDDLKASLTVMVEDVSPVEMNIISLPAELVFYRDSIPVFDGITVEITYNDGSKKVLSDGLNYSYDFSSIGKTLVKLFYGDLVQEFEVDVIEKIIPDESVSDVSGSESVDTSENSQSDTSVSENENVKKASIIEIIGIIIVCALLIVLAVFAIIKSNDIHDLKKWIKNKK